MGKKDRLTLPSLTPAPTANGGKDVRGRFSPGNKLGRGSPLAGRAAKIRALLLQKLTDAETNRIGDRLLAMAQGGNLAALRELLDRTIGKPTQFEVLERLDALTELLRERGFLP